MKSRSSSVPGASAAALLRATSLFVKGFEKLVRLVDQLLNAPARLVRLRAPLQRKAHDGEGRDGRNPGNTDPEQGAQMFLTRFRQLLTPSMLGSLFLAPLWGSSR